MTSMAESPSAIVELSEQNFLRSTRVLDFTPYRSKVVAKNIAYSDIINYARCSSGRAQHHCVMCGESGVSIPSQNKDVCKSCDSGFWFSTRHDLIVKFCKGCKNFASLIEFGSKPEASKCGRCRERGRQNYQNKKGSPSDDAPSSSSGARKRRSDDALVDASFSSGSCGSTTGTDGSEPEDDDAMPSKPGQGQVHYSRRNRKHLRLLAPGSDDTSMDCPLLVGSRPSSTTFTSSASRKGVSFGAFQSPSPSHGDEASFSYTASTTGESAADISRQSFHKLKPILKPSPSHSPSLSPLVSVSVSAGGWKASARGQEAGAGGGAGAGYLWERFSSAPHSGSAFSSSFPSSSVQRTTSSSSLVDEEVTEVAGMKFSSPSSHPFPLSTSAGLQHVRRSSLMRQAAAMAASSEEESESERCEPGDDEEEEEEDEEVAASTQCCRNIDTLLEFALVAEKYFGDGGAAAGGGTPSPARRQHRPAPPSLGLGAPFSFPLSRSSDAARDSQAPLLFPQDPSVLQQRPTGVLESWTPRPDVSFRSLSVTSANKENQHVHGLHPNVFASFGSTTSFSAPTAAHPKHVWASTVKAPSSSFLQPSLGVQPMSLGQALQPHACSMAHQQHQYQQQGRDCHPTVFPFQGQWHTRTGDVEEIASSADVESGGMDVGMDVGSPYRGAR